MLIIGARELAQLNFYLAVATSAPYRRKQGKSELLGPDLNWR